MMALQAVRLNIRKGMQNGCLAGVSGGGLRCAIAINNQNCKHIKQHDDEEKSDGNGIDSHDSLHFAAR